MSSEWVSKLKREGDEGRTFSTSNSSGTKMDLDDFRDCMSPTVVVETPGYQAARLGNFKSLQIFLLVSFFISLYVLIFEIIWFYWN